MQIICCIDVSKIVQYSFVMCVCAVNLTYYVHLKNIQLLAPAPAVSFTSHETKTFARQTIQHTHTNTPHVDWVLSNLYFDVEKEPNSTNLFTLDNFFEFPFYPRYRHVRHFVCFFLYFFWVSQICTRVVLLVNLLQLLFFTALRCNASTPEEGKKLFVSFSAVVFYFEQLTGNMRKKSIDILSLANSSKQN